MDVVRRCQACGSTDDHDAVTRRSAGHALCSLHVDEGLRGDQPRRATTAGAGRRQTFTQDDLRQVPDSASAISPLDLRLSFRMTARNFALERAIQASGIAATPAQILEYADRFYPFIAQELLEDRQ
jgi:hypothetical protein